MVLLLDWESSGQRNFPWFITYVRIITRKRAGNFNVGVHIAISSLARQLLLNRNVLWKSNALIKCFRLKKKGQDCIRNVK